jgi:hypothetical protein
VTAIAYPRMPVDGRVMRKHSFIVLLVVLGLAFLAVFSWAGVSQIGSKVPPSASITTAPPPGPITSEAPGTTAPPAGPITSEAPGPTAAPPGPITSAAPPGPAPSPGFDQVRDEESGLVTANAYWKKPDAWTVDQPQQIGLGIQSAPLTVQINERMKELPGVTQPAGQIQVSRHATAQLEAASDDAEVIPSESQNTSTPSGVNLYWIWTVRPKRPTSDLLWRPTSDLILTAYVKVHLDGDPNDDVTTPITTHISVHRTISYTAGEIATSWKTWFGTTLVGTVVAVARWFIKKTKRGKEQPTDSPTAKEDSRADRGT